MISIRRGHGFNNLESSLSMNAFINISFLNFEPLFYTFSKFRNYTIRGCLQNNLRNSSVVDFMKKFLKYFPLYISILNFEPSLDLSTCLGAPFSQFRIYNSKDIYIKNSQSVELEILRRSLHIFVYIFTLNFEPQIGPRHCL